MKLRPRFSLRTLAIAVSIICAYFGAWEATSKWGLPERDKPPFDDMYRHPFARKFVLYAYNPSAVAPFVVRFDENAPRSVRTKVYYVWLFGLRAKLPTMRWQENSVQSEKAKWKHKRARH
jgi:hypothetical protein